MYDKQFWNERYAANEYIYGTTANTFLMENIDLMQGPVLSLCEGEGRNAVYLASRGLRVQGVDCSDVGLKKAQALAQSRGVTIETEVADLAEYQPKENHYGTVISIFAHLPSKVRQRIYPMVEAALKPGGILLLEAYAEKQLQYDTGGPKDIDMLMTAEKLQHEFSGLSPILIREIEREVLEGDMHSGLASVVQFIARKDL